MQLTWKRTLRAALLFIPLTACGPSERQPDPPAKQYPPGATPFSDAEKAEIERRVAAAQPSTASLPCDTGWSETEIAARRATHLLSDMAVTERGLVITVDAERLAKRPPDTLASLVESADCAIAGPTGHLKQIVVQSEAGATIASYSAIELSRMRTRLRD